MSLGILNNLSAVYAENNLNNTNNSLSTVLQQLSSGSKINSGADDAAGLSLVNGLQANQQALTQSRTNATEGVGLLQVADGALSQVTSLLNRAVTLATEASNGTLNSTQDLAANQEYQSILSEVSNIGSTTTYNQEQVFNSKTNIYTGDSSSQGSSVDALNIRTLSASNVGDSNGVMAYSNGTNNVFLDLSSGGKNAAVTDSLGAAMASTTITANYLTEGAGGSAVNASANITVGAGTAYANTAQGLIQAINNSGLGLTATFGTAAQAGTTAVTGAAAADTTGGGGTDTGIIISGQGIGTGTQGAGVIGTLEERAGQVGAGTTSNLSSGTLSITGSDGATHNIQLGIASSTDTLANLAATINAANYGVTATLNTSGWQNGYVTNSLLTLTSANAKDSVSSANLVDATGAGDLVLANTPAPTNSQFTNLVGTVTNTGGNLTGGVLTFGSSASTITLGVAPTATTFGTQTLAEVAQTINAGNYGVTASTNSAAQEVGATNYAAGQVLNIYSANASDTFAATTTITTGGTATSSVNVANQNQIGTVGFSAGGAVAGDLLTAAAGLRINGTSIASLATDTLTTYAAKITASNLGVSASVNGAAVTTSVSGTSITYAAGTLMTLTSTNASSMGSIIGGAIVDATHGGTTVVQDTSAASNSAYYSAGVTGTVTDTTTTGNTSNTAVVADNNGSSGTATISYADAAGQSLANTDLTNQGNAQAALSSLNTAISDVSAQDGYIGAMINTLNSVSQVLSTQQENVQSAQNAVQATDYASATSNMSKYEILSQTGISALAQANSIQQEVTKLLQ
jgi:flagellin